MFFHLTDEELGHWFGVATHLGDALTFKILLPLQKVIYCSIIWSALDPTLRHKSLAQLGGEVSHAADKLFVRSKSEKANKDEPSVPRRMPTIDPKDLLGRTFLKDSESDGQRFRDRIVRAILEHDADMKRDPQHVTFLCEVNGDTADEIYTYNQVLDLIELDIIDMDSDTEHLFRFRRINDRQGPLRTSDADYKGSTYNVLVEWESGEITYEPLDMIGKFDPVTCTEYAHRMNLLSTPGWKRFRHSYKNPKKVESVW
jgi:hypothetical protein